MQLTLTSNEACHLLQEHLKIEYCNISIMDVAQRPPEPVPFKLMEFYHDLQSLINLCNTKREDGTFFSVKVERIKHVRRELRQLGLNVGFADAKQFIETLFPR